MTATADPALPVLPQRVTPCLARLTGARQWEPTMALRIDGQVVGMRTNPEAHEAIVHRFGHLRAPAYDEVVRPNFSVELAAPGSGALNLVYRDHVIVARRRHEGALLHDLDALLAACAHQGNQELLAVRASALVVRGESVVLLPASWHRALLMHQERLAATDIELLAAGVHVVAPDPARLLHPGPGAPGDAGSTRIVLWGLQTTAGWDHDLRPAQTIQLAFFTVANVAALGIPRTLNGLAGMAAHTSTIGLRKRPSADQVRTARDLAGRA